MTSRRILVVDDDADIRAVAQLALKKVGGWEVAIAASGSEGIASAIANPPDAILLDVMMPDLDGLSVYKALQANPATQVIPVILLTAKVQASEQRQFAELGVAAVITKPFKARQLPEQIATILGWNG